MTDYEQARRIEIWTRRLVLLIAALARPQWVQSQRLQSDVKTDIVFVLDVSNSMKALDLKPNRLTVAKQLIGEVVAERPFTRYASFCLPNKPTFRFPLPATMPCCDKR